MSTHVVLYSGGLDSFITWKWVQRLTGLEKAIPVYFHLGHRYAAQELVAVSETVPKSLIRTQLSGLGITEESTAYIHHRNLFLVAAASREIPPEETGTIWLTVQKEEMDLADRSFEFMQSMGALFRSMGQRIQVRTPWAESDKSEMVRWYLLAGFRVEELLKTWSCYLPSMSVGKRVHCGDCPACFRRAVAFYTTGVYENYLTDPFSSSTAIIYRSRAQRGEFSSKRCRLILEVVRG